MAKVKSSQIHTFINTTPESPHVLGSASATYERLGDGIVTGDIEMNPEVLEEQYIGEDNATTSVESYAPTMPLEQTDKLGDAAFEFLDQLRLDGAILADAETDIVNVWAYEEGGPTDYPAEQQKVAVSYEDFGGDAGASVKTNFTLHYIGDAVVGTFNASTKEFTAS
jgi:hypothetical protein